MALRYRGRLDPKIDFVSWRTSFESVLERQFEARQLHRYRRRKWETVERERKLSFGNSGKRTLTAGLGRG